MTSTPASTPLDELTTGSNYKFSAPPPEELGAESYTLVGIANDCSSSVLSYKSEMIKCLKQILESCQKSPRAENLMLRLAQFGYDVTELHGFRELVTIKTDEYDSILNVGGMTALNEGVFEMIETVQTYAKTLSANEFLANAIIFVITDGFENASKKATEKKIKDLIGRINKEESLESIQVVLIGITGGDSGVYDELQKFQTNVGIDKYINIDDATPSELAKLADWISQSVSSTSTALGTGQPSKLLSF